jgi:RNA polymerase sigma factor for flagellar operon FliA
MTGFSGRDEMRKASAERFRELPKEEEDSILAHLPLVKWIAYRLAVRLPYNLEIQDLISAGTLGLLQALRDFDPSRKNRFQTYASIRIRGAMLDAIREQDWAPRSFRDRYKKYIHSIHELGKRLGRPPEDDEIREELGLSQDQYESFLARARPLSFLSLEDLHLSQKALNEVPAKGYQVKNMDPGVAAELQEVRELLAQAIDSLPERERRIIQLYYFEELNLKEIGKVLGIGESRVCQLQAQALMRLKGKLRKEELAR